MPAAGGGAFIDGWGGRAVAVAVLACVVAALLTLHWDDLFPSQASLAPDDPLERCVAERRGEIEKMIAEAPAMASRRDILLERLPGLCASQLGLEGGGAPAVGSAVRP